jgi:uncharacterized membrane protein
METPASVKKHPLHPILIAFPIGLWGFSLICDLLGMLLADGTSAIVAFYALVGGLVGAIVAAIPGVIDMQSLKDAKLKRIALTHMSINIAVVIMYAVNLGLRMPNIAVPPALAVGLSAIALVLLGISGWLGAELVHVHGVSVADAVPANTAADKASATARSNAK